MSRRTWPTSTSWPPGPGCPTSTTPSGPCPSSALPPEGHQPPLLRPGALLLPSLFRPLPESPAQPNPLHAWNGAGGTRTTSPSTSPRPRSIGGLAGAAEGITMRPTRDVPCLFLLRLFSVLLGVLNVGAVLLLARHFLPGWWRLLPALLVATLPSSVRLRCG